MLYRNTKTGLIISAQTHVCGDWEPVGVQVPSPVQSEVEEVKPAKRKNSKKTAKKAR